PLDLHVVRELSKTRKSKFYYLLLKMTVANGWSFRWVENPDSLAPFKFLNQKITLPTHKQLGGKILDETITEFMSEIEKTAQKDKVGVTITLDAQDTSTNRSRASDIILKVEELFNDLESRRIKAIALVTDSAAAYAAA
ncbi:7943_t:CDS:2, partial [Ambispora gerdemannii]